MKYDELDDLTKPELIKLLQKQQETIRVLQSKTKQNGTSSEISDPQLETYVRQALRNIDDVGLLKRCSLLAYLADIRRQKLDGAQLQQLLTQTIVILKPINRRSNRQRQLRYDILRLTYLDKKKPVAIAKKLAISERQYYRELKGAVQLVTEHLFGSPG